MTTTYRARPLTLDAVRFDGSNLADVQQLIAGGRGVSAFLDSGLLVIRDESRADRTAPAGWWVSRESGSGQVTVHGAEAFSLLYEAAGER